MYLDITFPINQKMPKWPGSIGFKKKVHLEMPLNGNNLSSFEIDSHFGTHLDAPLHFIEGGKSVSEISLDKLIGDVYVLETYGARSITRKHFETASIPKNCKRLILKTDNQVYWNNNITEFQEDFCSIDISGALWLVENSFQLIGIDYLSIQRFNDGPEIHTILLDSGMVIVETLNLKYVNQGLYELICLPLNLDGFEGSPARVLLKRI